jgi:hypothetical protein
MKKWMEKEYFQWVYYDDSDGKIIGSVFKIGNRSSVWGAKVHTDNDEGNLGQYIDSEYSKKAVENFWNIMDRTLLEGIVE